MINKLIKKIFGMITFEAPRERWSAQHGTDIPSDTFAKSAHYQEKSNTGTISVRGSNLNFVLSEILVHSICPLIPLPLIKTSLL